MKSLYPVQERHVARLQGILAKYGSALDSSATGCGKTVCAAEIARHHPGTVLVVCPKAVIPSWEREFQERGVFAYVLNYEKLRTGKTGYGSWGPRGKTWIWNLPKGSLVIFDEAHRCAGIGTQNSKMLAEAKDRYKVLMLSATIASSPLQMRAAGWVLGLHALGNFYAWAGSLGCKKNRFNGMEFTGSEEAIARLGASMSHRVSRMTVADLKDHFAETQIITSPLDFGPDIQRIYEEMEEELQELTEKAKDDPKGAAANALTIQLRARQRAELLKVPVMVDMIADYLEEGKSIAVFVNFSQTIDALLEKVKEPAVKIDGRQSATERELSITQFQSDLKRIIVCNTAAGGVGVSLHDITGKHPRVAIISPDYDERKIVQAVGRVHRAGGKTPSQQHILFAAGTIEEQVEKAVRKKIKNLDALNEKSACHESTQPDIVSPLSHQPPTHTMPTPTPSNDNTPNHSARIHADYSPSSLKLFEACPSYKKREGANAIAEQGTKIHEAIDSGDTSLLNDEENAIAQFCFDFRKHIQSGKRAEGRQLVREIHEGVVNIRCGDETTFGSADLFEIYDDGSAVLMDWKTGFGAVEDAETNSQVWAYTLGFFQQFPEVNTIDAYLVLPRRQEVSKATFGRAEVNKLALRLGTIIARAKELAGKEFNPSEGVCDYCANRGSCKALANKALVIGQKAGFDVPSNISWDGTPEDRAKLLKLANLLSNWCEETKKELLRQVLEEGAEIPGYKLDQRRTPRAVDNPLLGYEAIKDLVSIEEFLMACGKVSVVQLEKFVAERAPKGGKAKAKEALEDRLRDSNALKEEGTVHVLKAIKA